MRGWNWNTEKDELAAKKKVIKAVKHNKIITKYDETNIQYISAKLITPLNKRHTKGYYYALVRQLMAIIRYYDIYADDETKETVRSIVLKQD